MNSAVMDYTPNWYQRINGAGYHDYMAISFGYGDVVDIYDNRRGADGADRTPLPADQVNPINTLRVPIKWYHGGESCNVDAIACWDYEWKTTGWSTCNAQGSWDIGGWGSCDSDCDGTQSRNVSCNIATDTQTRTVYCERSDGTTVADALCPGARPER